MASASVNRPVDEKVKERDVNNKLQLFGIFSAFANGKAPSNKQIDVALNSVLASKGLSSPSQRLSPEGQKLVADFRDVIEKAKMLVLTKNHGNLLQDFIWQTQHLSGGNFQSPNAPVDKDSAKQHGNEALDGLRTLGTLIISNGQFRKLLNDATILLRSIAGDAATKAAGRVNPDEDALAQIDDPADENTWHDVPDMSRGNIRNQVKSKYNEQKPFSRGDVKKATGDATEAANPSGSRDPTEAADLAARDQQKGTSSGVDGLRGAKTAVNQLQSKASENVPEETKDKARERRDRTQNYFKSKMPKDRREQTVWRMKKMVVEIQGHQDYQRAIETLLRLAEQYSGHSRNLVQQGSGTVKGAHSDNALTTAEADLKALIERFAHGTSLDDLIDSINNIYRDAERDPELKGWFKKMDAYIRKVLKQQGYIMDDAATDEWNHLYDQGNYLLRDRYRNHTDRIVDEFKFMSSQFEEDPQNKAFGDAMQKLFLDLGNDENGKPTFKPHLLKDLTDVIIPAFFTNVRYVPIPRIEYSDPMVDAVVENLVIEGDNLAPNVLEFGADNYWRWGRKTIGSKNKNKVMISVSGIQMDLRDVSYYVKKKQGFPSVTDTGVCDIFLGGTGLSFKIEMENADKKDRAHFFKINKVDVDIKHMTIKFKKSKHKLLLTIAKGIMLKVMRPAIQKVAEKQIRDNAGQLDGLLYQVYEEVKRAEADAKRNPDPENVQNIYQRYVAAANKKILDGKKKKDEVAADKKANMALTQHDSIFPNIKLPGGISTKATEYKDLAAKGDKWESPIFGIGSAKESSNIPHIPNITRKPHNVTQGGIRSNNPDLQSAEHRYDAPDNYQQGASAQYGQQGTGGQYGQPASTGQYGQQASTGQYGQQTSPGQYGQQTSTGQYGQQASTGQYGQQASTGQYGQSDNTSGFQNQVSQAFDGTGEPYKGINGSTNMGGTGGTFLGSQNPVLSGNI